MLNINYIYMSKKRGRPKSIVGPNEVPEKFNMCMPKKLRDQLREKAHVLRVSESSIVRMFLTEGLKQI